MTKVGRISVLESNGRDLVVQDISKEKRLSFVHPYRKEL